MGTSGLRRACILSLLFTSKARSLRSPKVQWALLVMPTLHTKHRTHVHRRMHMVLIQAGLLVPCLHRHLIRATLPTTHHMGTTRGTRHCRTCNIHRLMARLHLWLPSRISISCKRLPLISTSSASHSAITASSALAESTAPSKPLLKLSVELQRSCSAKR